MEEYFYSLNTTSYNLSRQLFLLNKDVDLLVVQEISSSEAKFLSDLMSNNTRLYKTYIMNIRDIWDMIFSYRIIFIRYNSFLKHPFFTNSQISYIMSQKIDYHNISLEIISRKNLSTYVPYSLRDTKHSLYVSSISALFYLYITDIPLNRYKEYIIPYIKRKIMSISTQFTLNENLISNLFGFVNISSMFLNLYCSIVSMTNEILTPIIKAKSISKFKLTVFGRANTLEFSLDKFNLLHKENTLAFFLCLYFINNLGFNLLVNVLPIIPIVKTGENISFLNYIFPSKSKNYNDNLIQHMRISYKMDTLLTLNRLVELLSTNRDLNANYSKESFLVYESFMILKSRFEYLPPMIEPNTKLLYPESTNSDYKQPLSISYNIENVDFDSIPLDQLSDYRKTISLLNYIFTPTKNNIDKQKQFLKQYIEINEFWKLLYQEGGGIVDSIPNDFQMGFSRLFNFYLFSSSTETRVRKDIF